MKEYGLRVAVPIPEGCGPSIGEILEFTKHAALDNDSSIKIKEEACGAHDVKLQSAWIKGLSVFSCGWEVGIESKSPTDIFSKFMDFAFHEMQTLASEWDSTFIDAEVIAVHGKADEFKENAKLVRWHFKMPTPLSNREMLYLVVPIVLAPHNVVVSYTSVSSARFPCHAGYTRAFNGIPSYDYARIHESELKLRHFMTTQIGGWISNKVWNNIFKRPVLKAYSKEATSVRNFLQAHVTAPHSQE